MIEYFFEITNINFDEFKYFFQNASLIKICKMYISHVKDILNCSPFIIMIIRIIETYTIMFQNI